MQYLRANITDTGTVFIGPGGEELRRLRPGHIQDVDDATDFASRLLDMPCPGCRTGMDRRLCDTCNGTGADQFVLTVDDAREATDGV